MSSRVGAMLGEHVWQGWSTELAAPWGNVAIDPLPQIPHPLCANGEARRPFAEVEAVLALRQAYQLELARGVGLDGLPIHDDVREKLSRAAFRRSDACDQQRQKQPIGSPSRHDERESRRLRVESPWVVPPFILFRIACVYKLTFDPTKGCWMHACNLGISPSHRCHGVVSRTAVREKGRQKGLGVASPAFAPPDGRWAHGTHHMNSHTQRISSHVGK